MDKGYNEAIVDMVEKVEEMKRLWQKKEYLTHLDYGVKTCPAIRDAFKELIDEHFEPKRKYIGI